MTYSSTTKQGLSELSALAQAINIDLAASLLAALDKNHDDLVRSELSQVARRLGLANTYYYIVLGRARHRVAFHWLSHPIMFKRSYLPRYIRCLYLGLGLRSCLGPGDLSDSFMCAQQTGVANWNGAVCSHARRRVRHQI